jgi:hypothetical protein
MRVATGGSLAILITATTACVSADGDESRVTHRDSAGVAIIENRAPAWSGTRAWRLAATPEVVIGGTGVAPEYDLFQANSAVRLPDGRIMIANSGSSELRFYDAEGRHHESVGRKGGGPGEFENLGWVARYGSDSLLAWDSRLRRLSVFDLDGRFQRSDLVENTTYLAEALLADGTLLARAMRRGPAPKDGSRRDTIEYVRFAVTGALLAPSLPIDQVVMG